ncbi:MAG: dTMP kinase [Pseudomonadota bacterium]|nr:dTMP kinase [Pseudomonadota bacterium]
MDNFFITFEGGEGSGKSTQATKLYNYLTENNLKAIKTREPGGTPSAEILRDILIKGKPERWKPLSEALLMWAARYEHVKEIILPAIDSGKFVICDRFYDSTYAYQGIAHKIGIEKMQSLKKIVIGDLEPSLTFILDIDPKEGLKRTRLRKDGEDRFENFNIQFHEDLREAYLTLADMFPRRCEIISGSLSVDEISKLIIAKTKERFNIP